MVTTDCLRAARSIIPPHSYVSITEHAVPFKSSAVLDGVGSLLCLRPLPESLSPAMGKLMALMGIACFSIMLYTLYFLHSRLLLLLDSPLSKFRPI